MKHDLDLVLDLAGHLYDTATNPRHWEVFFRELTPVLKAANIALLHFDRREVRHSIERSLNISAAVQRAHDEYYATINPWMVEGVRKGMIYPGALMTSQMPINDSEFEKTEFYNDFVKPNGFYHSMGLTLFDDNYYGSHFSVQRSKSTGPFDEDDQELMKCLLPHLQRALQLHSKFSALDQRAHSLLETLDRLTAGVVVVGSSGKVEFYNEAARKIIDQSDGLSMDRSGLRASRSEESVELQKLIGEVSRTTDGRSLGGGGVMKVSRPSSLRPYALLVSPLPRQRDMLGSESATAVVFVTDPEQELETSEEALTRLHHFTHAEARLAALLMRGRSLRDAADELCVSKETARSQVKTMFSKTDTHSQSELVRILLAGQAGFLR